MIASNLFPINEESYTFKYKESEFKVNLTNLNDEWNITYEISHPFFKLSQDTQFSYTNLIQISEIKKFNRHGRIKEDRRKLQNRSFKKKN